ncbi:ABC transporter ATP-binding protein [Embleya hyalina]|uniref:ABC transporter ATP-binding protein n=1 Tax=Embleya hyalina TaxID=516124 RepID=A0A401YQC4_9ACTN|nr:ABC transporter ATP-binding protein [Embleya hyalina]GCD96806.1 ABC transporter ATP-binding protein [Embleya hyalina]
MPRSRTRGGSATGYTPATSPVAARARGLVKEYGSGAGRVTALAGVDLELMRGGFTAIMGPSGSGKSTLMQCLAGLDTATRGDVAIGDTELGDLDDDALTELRRDRLGFVFQAFNLLPTLSALENITLPVEIAGRRVDRAHLDRIVEATGLADRLGHRPGALSGGQQQRVAVARALVARPELVFADEPTGNLDSGAGVRVLDLLRRGVDEWGRTVVMVTHDPRAAAYADRVVFLADGRIVDDLADPTADGVFERMRGLDGHAGPGHDGPDGRVGVEPGAGGRADRGPAGRGPVRDGARGVWR